MVVECLFNLVVLFIYCGLPSLFVIVGYVVLLLCYDGCGWLLDRCLFLG